MHTIVAVSGLFSVIQKRWNVASSTDVSSGDVNIDNAQVTVDQHYYCSL